MDIKLIQRVAAISAALLAAAIAAQGAIFQEEVSYRSFKLEGCTCYAAVIYTRVPEGLKIGVSAIAAGQGAEFRKWEITRLKLNLAGEWVRPDIENKFYVKKTSFFRVPAAVLFAAIGTQIDVEGTALEQGIAKTGAAVGLGLLVLQAQGELTGEKCVFNLDRASADSIEDGKDFIEITAENEGMHVKQTVRIGLIKPVFNRVSEERFRAMDITELKSRLLDLDRNLSSLEQGQLSYKYGEDPEYNDLQKKIEDVEAERGIIYRVLLEKERPSGASR